jgi:heme/copper-type cytochrome/quinol oxidase subunit 2
LFSAVGSGKDFGQAAARQNQFVSLLRKLANSQALRIKRHASSAHIIIVIGIIIIIIIVIIVIIIIIVVIIFVYCNRALCAF